MSSISQNRPIMQAPSITNFRYALKLSPQHIQHLNRDELLVLCMEQYFLLWLIISIIRNPLAAIATRVIAVDLIISFVEKTVKGSIQQITERSRVYISGDGGIAKRLGIHANTVSKSFNNLEKYRMIQRDYVYDEAKQKEYLDITITPLQVEQPQKLQDKTMRSTPQPKPKPTIPQDTLSPTPLTCPACGSGDIHILCRECGSVSTPEEVTTPSDESPTDTAIESTLSHNICVVDTNNTPLNGAVVVSGQGEEQSVSDDACLQEASPPPPAEQQETRQEMVQESNEGQVIVTWLERRIGHGKLIYATGSAEYSKKYYGKPRNYSPDYQAYLAGDKRHILGSYLSSIDGTTFVLSFDIDDPRQHKAHLVYLRKLAAAGAAPVYWLRGGERGHLEVYFDRRVGADRARDWCISVCPELEKVEECYPAADKRNQPIAWPLYQRKGDTVTPCSARAILPQTTQVRSTSVTNRQGLAKLIVQAITPAALIEAYQLPEIAAEPAPESSSNRQVAAAPPPTAENLAKAVIAEFNQTTTWDEVVGMCGGFNREGKFLAVWRSERTPSVAIDANGQFASDYGRTGTFPRKLDKYEVWCLAQGGTEFKRFDLAQRIAAYRACVKSQGEASPSPTLAQNESEPETGPAQPRSTQPVLQPNPNETADEVVERLRLTSQQTNGRVMTPAGPGKLWQIWNTRIGVVLESDPDRVKFFKTLEEMRQVVARDDEQAFLS